MMVEETSDDGCNEKGTGLVRAVIGAEGLREKEGGAGKISLRTRLLS